MRARLEQLLGALTVWGVMLLAALLVLCGIAWAARTLAGLVMGL
jgi:hypothetical protein